MTFSTPPPDGLTPDESRYVDGEMSEAEARSMAHRLAADPAAEARVQAWRNAMDLWRDDAKRAAAPLAAEPDALVDRILADRILAEGLPSHHDRGGSRVTVAPYAARWYAAAAVLLMAVGITGTVLAQPETMGLQAGAQPQVAGIEEIFLDVMTEGSEFAPGLTSIQKSIQNGIQEGR